MLILAFHASCIHASLLNVNKININMEKRILVIVCEVFLLRYVELTIILSSENDKFCLQAI